MVHQIASVVGAVLILAAYGASQAGLAGPHHKGYNLANLVGSLLLLWVAVVDWRLGFILLEATWALISVPHLFRRAATPTTSPES